MLVTLYIYKWSRFLKHCIDKSLTAFGPFNVLRLLLHSYSNEKRVPNPGNKCKQIEKAKVCARETQRDRERDGERTLLHKCSSCKNSKPNDSSMLHIYSIIRQTEINFWFEGKGSCLLS